MLCTEFVIHETFYKVIVHDSLIFSFTENLYPNNWSLQLCKELCYLLLKITVMKLNVINDTDTLTNNK
jgi:hypothetical protein